MGGEMLRLWRKARLVDCRTDVISIFVSFLVLSISMLLTAVLGARPPDPSVHWAGHSWIHLMKRLHVMLSIGCFLIELSSAFFALFALHRILCGGFDTYAPSAAELLVRELEFETVAVHSYFFAGAVLLMGPVAIHCFCMVQQGLRSDMLAASVCCLIAGVSFLILSFFNAYLTAFPYGSYEKVVARFIELSFARCAGGGTPAAMTLFSWCLQGVSVILAILSLVETFPWNYYRSLASDPRDSANEPSMAAEASIDSREYPDSEPSENAQSGLSPHLSGLARRILPAEAQPMSLEALQRLDPAPQAATVSSRPERVRSGSSCLPGASRRGAADTATGESLLARPLQSGLPPWRGAIQQGTNARVNTQGSARKGLSVASSMQSLDSLIVD
ncbi:hypothetical protein AB1Y20_000458 [Prymnesium parvum]|uniref:Transmembrane protein n=1 Tax=Prymnesium parvum TaxID=97485 RepID=A0AB34K867_PRYPA